MADTIEVDGKQLAVDEEGYLSNLNDWVPGVAGVMAKQDNLELTDEHWAMVRFLRSDFEAQGETATLRRASTQTGVPVKRLFELFPAKPAKKMSYISGLPKPKGCV